MSPKPVAVHLRRLGAPAGRVWCGLPAKQFTLEREKATCRACLRHYDQYLERQRRGIKW